MSISRMTTAAPALLILVSYQGDSDSAKRQYLEDGNRYAAAGNFKEAVLQFQHALKIDPGWGPAHYELGVVYLKEKPPQVPLAVAELRKAVALLREDAAHQEEYKASMVRLADLDLTYDSKNKQSLEDVETYCNELLRKNHNSFDGFRLLGDLNFRRAVQELELDPTGANKLVNDALANYRKAETLKPDDTGVGVQIAQILQLQKHYAEAERYLRKAIDNNRIEGRLYVAYMQLYRLYVTEQKLSEANQLLKEAALKVPERRQEFERLAIH